MKLIGDKIRTLRKNKGLTQEKLAEALSVTAQSISKWENGLSAPDIALLPVIARFFSISIDDLFSYRLDALSHRERFICSMANQGALRFGEFRLTSGRISPYHINTNHYRFFSQTTALGEFYADHIIENRINSDLLIANSAREIPSVIAAGQTLFHKYGIDISYSIDCALGRQMESTGSPLLIKDTLTSGNSLKTWLTSNKNVSDILVAVDRMERGQHPFLSSLHEIELEFNVSIHAIVTLDDIIRALEKGLIAGSEYLPAMMHYREKYGGK